MLHKLSDHIGYKIDLLKEILKLKNEVKITEVNSEYFSKEYVFRNVLMLGDEEIKEMKKQIADEESSGEIPDKEAEAEAQAQAEAQPPAPTPVQIVKPEKEEDNG
jgi:hypothetical protein